MESVPMERVFGKEVGDIMTKEHNKNGVKLHMNSGV
jgi:NADPH-dependent 2,4-dienoyl-CoA reductase/sulfur reductase-like enzyme